MSVKHGGRGPGHLSRWPKAAGEGPASDVTAPILSSPLGVPTGPTTANLSVETNEATGTLYWYISESATPPSAADLKAGTGAVEFANQAVSSSGAQGASADALTAETTYYVHFLHRDAAGNDSFSIATSASFTTEVTADADLWMGLLENVGGQSTYPPELEADFSNPYLLSTDTVRLQISTSPTFASIHAEETLTLGTGALTWTILTGIVSGEYYFRERMERGAALGPWSNTAKIGDTAAPVLTSASGTQTGITTADISVSTDEGEGTIYWTILPAASAAPTTGVDFITGSTGGVATGSTDSPITGANVFPVTGLTEGTEYKAHFYQQDLALEDSNIISSAAFITADATGPTISSPTAVPAGPVMAYMTFSSSEGAGTAHWYISTSATPPSETDLKAGTGATAFGSQAVTASGAQSLLGSGLSAGTSYYAHMLHSDSGGNDSNIVTSASFTTVNLPQTSSLRLYSEPVLGTMYTEVAQTNKIVGDSEPVGYFPDFSGYSNNFISNDGTGRPTYRTGTPDYVNFDGSTDHMWKDSPSFNLWTAGSFTVAMALKANPAVGRMLLAMTSSSSDTPRVDILKSNSVTASTAVALMRSDANTIFVNNVTLGTSVWDNTDTVVVVTDTGSSLTMYVDGVAGASQSYTRGAHVLTLNRLSLGALYGNSFLIPGAMQFHALAIWPGVVLSGPEIAQVTTALGAIQGRSI